MLEIRLLGELEVRRDGTRLALPPSRKTRALLAYLVATGRRHRRERLCSLLWEVPDDPRGALRWSLSRLRALVDGPAARRIVADRETVGFDANGALIDIGLLRHGGKAPHDRTLDELKERAGLFRGEFLEGIDQPDLDGFQAWVVAEREDMRRLQVGILETIAERMAATPETALPYVRRLVQVDPYNASARSSLLGHLVALGRRTEAEQQFEAGVRQLRETGDEHALVTAWRGLQSRRDPAEGSIIVREAAAPSVPASGGAADPPLIGRAAELSRLAGFLSEAPCAAGAQVVLITGEPGVGKSRLLEEAITAAKASRFEVVNARAREADRGRPYSAWPDQIGPVAPSSGVETDEHAAVARERFLVDVSTRILDRGGPGPLLLVLDDVHWCDAASVELLHVLLGAERERALLVLLGARSGELADNPSVVQILRSLRHERRLHEIRLGPLDADAAESLVRSVAPGPEAARIAAECCGNPLFAIALARDAAPRGGEPLPRSLKELISDRVDRLPESAAEALRWASVLGTSFAAERLLAVSGLPLDGLVAALASLERHDFIRTAEDGGSYLFVHDLVHRSVYTALSEPRRRLMHLRIAETLCEQGRGVETMADEVVHHAVRGGDNGRAAGACVEAGRRSLRLFANVEAAAFARRGLHHAEGLPEPERLMRRIELTRIALLAKRPADIAEAAQTLELLAESALDHDCPDHARIAYETLSLLRWERGFFVDAERDTLRAELASRNADEGTRMLAMAETARCLVMLERDLPQADALLMEAAALARRLNIEPGTISDATGLLRVRRGELDAAAADFERARFLARRDGDRITEFFAMEHLAGLELARGRFAAAEVITADMKRLAGRLGAGSEAPFAAALDALCRVARGEPRAQAELESAVVALRHADAKQRLSLVLRTAAEVDLKQGRHERARARAGEALELAGAINCRSEMAGAEAMLAAAVRILDEGTPGNRGLAA